MDIGNRTLSMADLQKNTLVSGNKAMQMLELSRHSFEKVVKDGLLTIIYENGKKYYQIGEIEAFMSTDTYTELVNGVVDPRNSLNDLTGKDWLPETKSFFYQKGLGANHPEAQIEKLHPALKMLIWFSSNPAFKQYRTELLSEMIRSIKYAIDHDMSIFDAANHIRKDLGLQKRYTGFKFLSSRTLLSKGLEFDCVIIDMATPLSAKDFYVAMTRAMKKIYIISDSNTFIFRS